MTSKIQGEILRPDGPQNDKKASYCHTEALEVSRLEGLPDLRKLIPTGLFKRGSPDHPQKTASSLDSAP